MKLQNMISDGDKVQVYEVDGKAVKVFRTIFVYLHNETLKVSQEILK